MNSEASNLHSAYSYTYFLGSSDYYERSFLIVLHNVWSTGPGKTPDPIFELRARTKGWQLADRHHAPERGRIVEYSRSQKINKPHEGVNGQIFFKLQKI